MVAPPAGGRERWALDTLGTLVYTAYGNVRGAMAENQIKSLWTVKMLAAAAGVTRTRIRQILIAGRELRGHKAGTVWIVSDSEARRWLKERGIEVS